MRVGLFIISLCLYLMSSTQPTLSMSSEIDEIQSARRVLCLGLQDKETGKTWSETSS